MIKGKIVMIPGPLESLPPPTPSVQSLVSTVIEGDPGDDQSSGDETVVPEGRVSRLRPPVTETHSGSPSAPNEAARHTSSITPTQSDQQASTEENHNLQYLTTAVQLPRSEEEENLPGLETEPWQSVKSGSTECIQLDESLDLYVEYTTSHPSTGSKPLRLRARELSKEESLMVSNVYDVEDLQCSDIVCNPHSRNLFLRRGGGQIFEVNWDAFVIPLGNHEQ
jgi:hypothetical protein